MAALVSFTVTFLLLFGGNHSDQDVTLPASVRALIELGSLTYKTCDELQWCSLHLTSGTSENLPGTSRCCPACPVCPICSCEDPRVNENNLCPDFKLSKILDGAVYETYDDWLEAVENAKYDNNTILWANVTDLLAKGADLLAKDTDLWDYDTDLWANDTDLWANDTDLWANDTDLLAKFTEEDSAHDETQDHDASGESRDNRECRSASLFDISMIIPDLTRYRMISSCQDATVTNFENTLCKRSPSEYVLKNIWHSATVQSLSTGYVYRNIHCFYCSLEVEAAFNTWDIHLMCRTVPKHIFMDLITSELELFNYANRNDSSCGLVYKPSRWIQTEFPAETCPKVDKMVCDISTTNEWQRMACEKYTSPVYALIDGKETVFNNIACVACSGYDVQELLTGCMVRYWWQRTTTFTARIKQHLSPGDNQRKPIFDHTLAKKACDPGYVYDSKKLTCRKLFCPCGMILQDNSCNPIFDEIPGSHYEVHVKVKPGHVTDQTETSADEIKAHMEEEYESALFDYFHNDFFARSGFEETSLTLLRKWNSNNAGPDHVAFLRFIVPNHTTTFLEVIEIVRLQFRSTKTITVASIPMDIDLMVTDSVQVNAHVVVDINTEEQYIVAKQSRESFERLDNNNVIRISECNFCYRVVLFEDEISRHPSGMIVKDSHVVGRDFLSRTFSDDSMVVCADEVITASQAKNISTDSGKTGLDKLNDLKSEYDLAGLEKETIIQLCVFFALLCGIVCIIGISGLRERDRNVEDLPLAVL